jgi:hypothetical protein
MKSAIWAILKQKRSGQCRVEGIYPKHRQKDMLKFLNQVDFDRGL